MLLRFSTWTCAAIILGASFAHATGFDQRKNGIDAAMAAGDFYRAFRVASIVEQETPAEFPKVALEAYLKSIFVVGSTNQIKQECDRLSAIYDSAKYICALRYAELKKVEDAVPFYSAIPKSSKFYWPAQIVKATCELVRNRPDDAVETLKVEEVPRYKALQLDNLFYLTRARALIALEQYDDGIRFSQAVEAKSPYYVEALEQTAWVFFKTRRLESSQILLDVLVANYESIKKSESDIHVSPSLYFRARYLRAYLALVEQRPEGASNEFSQLRGEFNNFFQEFRPRLTANRMATDMQSRIVKMNELPAYLDTQFNFISEWLGADIAANFEQQVRLQVALNVEISKLKYMAHDRNPAQAKLDFSLNGYLADLEKLKNKSFAMTRQQYGLALSRLMKAMDILSLKTELGRMDVFWLNRAEGARNLDEVIDNYKQTTKSLENYMAL